VGKGNPPLRQREKRCRTFQVEVEMRDAGTECSAGEDEQEPWAL